MNAQLFKNSLNKYFIIFLFLIVGCSDDKPHSIIPNSINIKNELDRFKITSPPLNVIDSSNGHVWRITGPNGGPYYLVRICYLASDGKSLMPTPYEEDFTDDLKKFENICKNK